MNMTTTPEKNVAKIRYDIIAGISIAGLLLPEAIAHSGIAGLPPQAGIIALLAGLLCYGIIGKSRYAIVSPTSSSAAVLGAATLSILPLSQNEPAVNASIVACLVAFTGILFFLTACLRLSNITAFIAKPVLRGFTFGLSIVIILGQFGSMTGIHTAHGNAFSTAYTIFLHMDQWNHPNLLLGLFTLGLLYAVARFKRFPGALTVVVLSIVAAKWLPFANLGLLPSSSTPIDLQLSTLTLPALPFEQWLLLGKMAFVIALVLYAESYGSIHSFAIKHEEETSPNRDLLALGSANLLSGVFGGMPVGAGYSGTSANEAAGAGSSLSGRVALNVIFILVLVFLPSIALIQQPVLAAIVIYAVSRTLSPAVFHACFRWRRDRLLLLATIFSVLFLGILDGLLAAIAISIVIVLHQLSSASTSTLGRLGNSHDFVPMHTHPQAVAISGLLIVRPNQAVFFANVERIFNQIRQTTGQLDASVHSIIISLEESPDLDSSSLETLIDFCHYANKHNKHLLFARLKEPVIELLKRANLPVLSSDYLTELSVDEAVRMASAKQSEQTDTPH